MVTRGPLSQTEYEQIYAQVPRLTVEVVVVSGSRVLLAMRNEGPCGGLWHLPGGTVRFGEHLTDAVHRVAEQELGVQIAIDRVLGYIEYPSHVARNIDWPVGIAFEVHLTPLAERGFCPRPGDVDWFGHLPEAMHQEQRTFLKHHGLAV